MFDVNRGRIAGFVLLLAAMLVSARAFAQTTDFVPHALPGNHPYLTEWLPQFGIPLEAAKGHRETLYPEYQLKIKKSGN